jgi:sigma-B regulation protein RsbU (phosphoserine phosphatase)
MEGQGSSINLSQGIFQFLFKRYHYVDTPMNSIPSVLNPPKILIIDDEKIQRIILRKALESEGYKLLEANGSEEGLDYYQKFQPDIILLDALMPDMDGFECCKAIRQLPDSEIIPILMITGLEARDAIEKAFHVGATDFITKPIQMTVVRQRIQHLLRAYQAEKALRQSEKKYRSLVMNLEEIIFQTNQKGEFTFLNTAWKNVTEFEIYESLGKNFKSYIVPEDHPLYEKHFRSLLSDHVSKCHYHLRFSTKTGHEGWMDIFASPLKNVEGDVIGISGYINDSTERRQRDQYQRLAYSVANILSNGASVADTLNKVLKIISGSLHWQFAELWQLDLRTKNLECNHIWYLKNGGLLDYEKVVIEMKRCSKNSLASLIDQTKEPQWILTEFSDLCGMNVAYHAGLHSALGCPIISDQTCVGAMIFLSKDSRKPNTNLFKLLITLGRQIGQFIKRKEAELQLKDRANTLQEEIARASEYVESLLPAPLGYATPQRPTPQISPVKIQRMFAPCSQLGGDAFDYFWIDGDHLVIYLVDVAGHGVKSALVSVSVLNVLRSRALSQADLYHPASVLKELNNTFQMNEVGDDYFTIWYGVYNRQNKTLLYSSGGHPPALAIYPEDHNSFDQSHANYVLEKLVTTDISIGLMPEWDYQEKSFQVPDGSSLFVFSDGAYEIMMPNEELWGLNQFASLLTEQKKNKHKKHEHQKNQGLCLEDIYYRVKAVNSNLVLEDDFSLLECCFCHDPD